MGYTIYFQSHENGGDQQVETEKIVKCFEPYITKRDEFGFEVKYDEVNSSFVLIDLAAKTCSEFSVDRPCGDKRLFESIYKVTQLGNYVSLEDDRYFVFNEQTIENLPEDMEEDLAESGMKLIVVKDFEHYYSQYINH
jgi:hypothetical protein